MSDKVVKKIELDNVTFYYDDEKVISNVSLEINEGEFIGIVGDNGAGKSTLLKLIAQIRKPSFGKVENNFTKVSYLSQINMGKKNSFSADIREIVSLGLKKKPFTFMTKNDWKKVDETLEHFGIKEISKKRLDEVSGGQQEKVRLAECLINEPDLLLLDEPTSGIDIETREEIKEHLSHYQKRTNATIVMISHLKDDFPSQARFIHLNSKGEIIND